MTHAAARSYTTHFVVLGTFALLISHAQVACAAMVPEHPLIEKLRTSFPDDRTAAAQQFWRQVEARGTPLVEQVAGESGKVAVTFIWRAHDTAEIVDVALIGSFVPGGSRVLAKFEHVAGTDVWHMTMITAAAARYRYYLVRPQDRTVDATAISRLEIDGDTYELFSDPQSRLAFDDEFEGRAARTSYFEGPDAPAEPWQVRRAGVAQGRLVTREVMSTALGHRHLITIYLPPFYRPQTGGHPFLLLFDAEKYLTAVPTQAILDNLISDGAIPPLIAVLVDSVDERHRGDELAPNPRFLQFITQELLPVVSREFPLSGDPGRAVAAGSSLGGLASSYLALHHSDRFGNVLSLSGSYWWYPGVHDDDTVSEPGWLARQFVTDRALPIRFYLDVGRGEGEGMLNSNRLFRDLLSTEAYEMFYREVEGDHSYLNWRSALAEGLICLIGRRETRRCIVDSFEPPNCPPH